MSNTMTLEQAAEKYFKEWAGGLPCSIDAYDVCISGFLAGHAHAQNRWVKWDISPEKSGYYLCVKPPYLHQILYFDKERDIFTDDNSMQSEIEYWMELPQPPEHG